MRKFVKRSLQVLLGLVCLCVILVASLVLWTAINPARATGVHRALAPDPGHAPIPVIILYPTTDAPSWTWFGAGAVKLAEDGAVDGSNLPMVVVSHGTGATQLSHFDTALALVDAGYVVVVPLHNGDNFQDDSRVGTGDWIVDRARHIARVDDYALNQWPQHAHLDPARIGLFGFSAGGTTGLVTIGGTPDLSLVARQCATRREFVCDLLPQGATMRLPAASEWVHDPRVRAAVIVAPGLGFAFPPGSFAGANLPVQLWAGAADENVPVATNAGAVRALLPVPPEFHLVANAGHFSFLPRCLIPRQLCTDPEGFDRRAFHASFNREVVAFFNRALPPR